jgi:uroporphyrinogen-III decarboxylase
MARYGMEMAGLGYPSMIGAHTFCAFDWLSDCLRGMRGTAMDMYQVPDRLLATIDMLMPSTLYGAIAMTQQTGIKSACIYLHRGSAGFMSDAQFARFYWPCLKGLILGLIDAGIRPIVYTEGNYTPRLKYFQELPAKKFVMHYQEADRHLAKKLLGDISCFWGNVSSALMCTGTPEQVSDDVKALIDIFGDNGGLIIDSSVGIPDEAKFENVQALTNTVRKYGNNAPNL